MKTNEASAKFLAGQPCLIVEFRNSKAERIKWRDKESKQMMEAPLLRHSVEASDGTPYIVNERVDEKFDEKAFKARFKKGQRVLLNFVTMSTERGIIHFGGSLETVED